MKIKKTIKNHLENLGVFLLSGFFGYIGMALLEYEVAKVRSPGALFLKTPSVLISITSELLLGSSIVILAMLVIIYYKRLENRRWLWYVLIFEFILFLVSLFSLGIPRFDIIVFG